MAKTSAGIKTTDILNIFGIFLGGTLVSGLVGILGVPILNSTFEFLPVEGSVPEPERDLAIQNAMILFSFCGGVIVGGMNYLVRHNERKCPHCNTAWARDKTGYIRTQSENTVHESKTEKEYQGSGDHRKSRTKDILSTYKVHVYDEIRECASCGEESEIRRTDKTLVKKVVTATTPWQYD
jgi:hypothetical protein